MKPTWTKIYGPPFCPAKQRAREMAQWRRNVHVGVAPPADAFCEVLTTMMETAAQIYTADFNAAIECALFNLSPLKEEVIHRLEDLGVSNTDEWYAHLKQGECLVVANDDKPFIVGPSCLWINVLHSCGIVPYDSQKGL